MKVYGFLYNSCIHESSWTTISLHKTREGAEKVMNIHKEEAKIEYEAYLKRHAKSIKKYCKEEKINKEEQKFLLESVSPFGAHEDWAVEEFEILD